MIFTITSKDGSEDLSEYMSVGELIEALKTYPPDCMVQNYYSSSIIRGVLAYDDLESANKKLGKGGLKCDHGIVWLNNEDW